MENNVFKIEDEGILCYRIMYTGQSIRIYDVTNNEETFITKETAKQLGEWLIKASE